VAVAVARGVPPSTRHAAVAFFLGHVPSDGRSGVRTQESILMTLVRN
jgi:hypothetical protein